MSRPFALAAWRLATTAVTPFASLYVRNRAARGKEDSARMQERLGLTDKARPEGRLIWIHGASVGESLSALPLVHKLLQESGTHVLVTSGTVASATVLEQRLPAGALHQYVPLDTPRAVTRFLNHWKPDAGLFVESDLWPNLIAAARAHGVRLALINARMSARSARGWRRAGKSAAALLSAFHVVLAQDDDVALRFRDLGARNVQVVGSLKADAPPLPIDDVELAAMHAAIGGRPVLLAAQTHPGEDETVLPAHDLLRARFPNLLTIIVPRHIERGGDIEMLCGRRVCVRRSTGGAVTDQTAIYIADTLGELGLLYRLAPLCFLGGTLVPLGGHNPLEPAALHCAVLAGPHIANARPAFDAVLTAQGFGRIENSAEIAREAARILSDPAAAQMAGDAAAHGAATLSGAGTRTIAALKTMLDARA
jgi:3-deoxy-D-manno-octulosonic-acid transferase